MQRKERQSRFLDRMMTISVASLCKDASWIAVWIIFCCCKEEGAVAGHGVGVVTHALAAVLITLVTQALLRKNNGSTARQKYP